NILVSEATVGAMASAYEAASGSPLAARLLAALAAGQAAGGDPRRPQAAPPLGRAEGPGHRGAGPARGPPPRPHPPAAREPARPLALHELYCGETPANEWLPVTGELAAELRDALAGLGYATGELAADLDEWAGYVNLEERVSGAARIDPVVLAELRRAAAG